MYLVSKTEGFSFHCVIKNKVKDIGISFGFSVTREKGKMVFWEEICTC